MATKEQKKRKIFSEKLLKFKGIDYDAWLDVKHKEVIAENDDLIMEALEEKLDRGNKIHSSE